MKFLFDMNLSPVWAGFLIAQGFEAVHWSTMGAGHASDAELMLWAAEHGHIVVTCDLDFPALLAGDPAQATQRHRDPQRHLDAARDRKRAFERNPQCADRVVSRGDSVT